MRGLQSCAAALLLCQAVSANALGLMEAYDAALKNDPTYRSAVYDREAGQEYKVMGLSNLLPNLSASYSNSQNRASVTGPGAFGLPVTSQENYNSMTAEILLRQPIINLDGLARYRQGIAQTEYSDAQFSSKRQDLVTRLVTAYAKAKYAEDLLALVEAQKATYVEQQKMNERMFEKGEGTKTDMLETEARSQLADAELLEAEDGQIQAKNELAAIVGREVNSLDVLKDDFRVKPMQPSTFEEWKQVALTHNPDILAQQKAVEAARQEINKNRAGHAPRLDFVASVDDNESQVIYMVGQKIRSTTVGVQLNVPLYSGGSVNASTRQAVSNHEKALSDLEGKTRQVLNDLHKNYSLALSSALRIAALEKTLDSAKLLVEATQKSVQGGLRTNLDVLNAKQQVYVVRRDLAQARYSYIQYYLQLRQAAGIVGEADLREMAAYFEKP